MQFSSSRTLRRSLVAATIAALGAASAAPAVADSQVTLIHTGDFHGHLIARPNLRSNGDGGMTGGLARMYKKITMIREDKGPVLLMHTGDTLQGSGEALYTRGQAMVDVVDMFGVDAYAPGNWDFVYGPDRFKELFVNADGTSKRWGGLVANLYVDESADGAPPNTTKVGSAQDENVSQVEADAHADWYFNNGTRVLPPTSIKYINGAKVGVIGCTTTRGPQVVGSWVTTGLSYTDCSREVQFYAKKLRTEENVDLLVLISEIEIGRNIQLIKTLGADQHIDIVLNSDMHEEALEPIQVTDAAGRTTLISEQGMDGTMISEISFQIKNGQVRKWDFTAHRIDANIPEDNAVAAKVAEVRHPFNDGFTANTHLNPFSGTYLNGPLSDVVGNTDVALHRSNFSHEDMPAVIEGSSHDFIADAIRWWAQSDLATVRGFRYGTTVKPLGPITRNDLFHYVPIGPRVAKVSRIAANQLRNQIDNSSLAVLSSNPGSAVTPLPRYNGGSPSNGLPAVGLAGSPMGWGGGWLFAYSANGGFHMDFAPYYQTSAQTVKTGAPGSQGSGIYLDNNANIQVNAPPTDTSRARSLTLKVLCKQLPPLEIVSNSCSVTDLTTRYTTVITEASNGVYKNAWKANYSKNDVLNYYSAFENNTATATTGFGYQPYLLNPDGWQYVKGTPNQPNTNFTVNQHFKAGLFTVAGYWYAQSPNTVNNCNNCYPTGTSTVVGDPNAAYLLPVNVGADGNAALDADGNPKFVRDGLGNVIMDANGKPTIEGSPIDLTVIMEKYLASLGTVNADNLKLNRIGLVNNAGTTSITLPDTTSTLGVPTMQPLCGTIGKTATSTLSCP